MKVFPLRAWLATWLCLTIALRTLSAEPAAPTIRRPLDHVTLHSALRAAAERDGVALEGMRGLGVDPHLGDSVTLIVGTREGEKLQQYLLQLRRGVATPEELKEHAVKPITKYVSWGPVITFKSDVEAIDVWLAGPADPSSDTALSSGAVNSAQATAISVKRFRVFVPVDSLRLGLDNVARFGLQLDTRTHMLQKDDPAFQVQHIYALDKPVKPDAVARAKPFAEKLQISDDVARAWVGGHVALQAFYAVADGVKPLREIADIAIARPSLIKLAKLATGASPLGCGIAGNPTFRIDPVSVGLIPVKTECFSMPFEFTLDKDSIVSGAIAATKPVSPLDLSAGILGVIAVNPKDLQRVVQLQVIAVSAKSG